MNAPTLSETVLRLSRAREAWFWSAELAFPRSGIASAPWFGPIQGALAGRSVLVRTPDQLRTALALTALDGAARRMVICPPDLKDEHLPLVFEDAGTEAVVEAGAGPSDLSVRRLDGSLPTATLPAPGATEWVMFTSGTTGRPKMVRHTLAGLTGAIRPAAADAPPIVWGTFYDTRRYGGLQILLRALVGGVSLVLSSAGEPTAALLQRLGAHGVTHLSGTPSHWRRALMTPAIAEISPAYVRLSGEIADQAVLDALKSAFPRAAIGHAYASTEAGVGFEVTDGLEGFPAAFVGAPGAAVEMKVQGGALHIRSPRAALGYVGEGAPALADAEGFVDTGDLIEHRRERYYFVGRRGGIINVGGLKIHPEEVEAVINAHPAVRLSRVSGRRNPITGAIVTAEVVAAETPAPDAVAALKAAILEHCRLVLPPHKAPASVRFVDELPITAAGKLERPYA